ncbi:MAG: YicC/YloC family endoribonuclease [Planctomycetota bacterium]|nr:YicC/YloC family endoribonuclease [Planctomycetota bacterium]
MLLSMTGFGEAETADDVRSVSVEVRAVNNRYLKINQRLGDWLANRESSIEKIIRQFAKRGTIHLQVRVNSSDREANYRLNAETLNCYREQLQEFHRRHPMEGDVTLGSLLHLPGVVEEATVAGSSEDAWALAEPAIIAALEQFNAMRRVEGQAMEKDMLQNIDAITGAIALIENRIPQVTEDYTSRLQERLEKLLAPHETSVEPTDIVREVALFAERSDISEEVVRLHSHIEQFRNTIHAEDGIGRRLEFVTQEMFRETNTIGSKANDTEISKHVIDIKAAIERIREMVQNIE